MSNFELQYLNVLSNILQVGVDKGDRTSVGSSRSIWGCMLEIDIADGFPIITTRKTSARIAFEETWFFLRGQTDTKILEAKKVNIWKGNTTREFLDGRGLNHLPEGNLGKGYGFQWRNFGGGFAGHGITDGSGVDQLRELIHALHADPNSRRHIITGWNPQQLHEMALPPCHLYQQYQILDGRLNSMFLMRSWDALYGAPFNIMGYALLNIAIAKLLNLEPGKLLAIGNDVHLYANQLEIAKEQVKREPYSSPSIKLKKELYTFDDLLNIEFKDFKIEGYEAWPDFKNKPGMAV